MALGLGLLRLPPRQFWDMTPREIAAAMRGLAGDAAPLSPPTRSDLSRLEDHFKDRLSRPGGCHG